MLRLIKLEGFVCLFAAQPWFDERERQALAYAMMSEALTFMAWLLLGLAILALLAYLIGVIALCRATQRQPLSPIEKVAAETPEPETTTDEFAWQVTTINSYSEID